VHGGRPVWAGGLVAGQWVDVDCDQRSDCHFGERKTRYALARWRRAINFDRANDYVWMLGATTTMWDRVRPGFTMEWWMKREGSRLAVC